MQRGGDIVVDPQLALSHLLLVTLATLISQNSWVQILEKRLQMYKKQQTNSDKQWLAIGLTLSMSLLMALSFSVVWNFL